MKFARAISTLAVLAAVAFCAACQDSAPQPPKKPAPDPKKQWTPQEISADPEGYLEWADWKISNQIVQRKQKRDSLGPRLAQVKTRQENLTENITNAENYAERIETAARRAEDEERWPMKVGGVTFMPDQAKAAVAQLRKYAQDHKPLAQSYEEAVAKIRQLLASLDSDIESLGRAREKLALNLEQVRLNRSMADVDGLRRTEEEIAGFDQALSRLITEESLSLDRLPTDDKATQKVDVNTLIHPK